MERQKIYLQMQAAWKQMRYHEGMLNHAKNEKLREHHKWWMGYERGRASGLRVAYQMAGGK